MALMRPFNAENSLGKEGRQRKNRSGSFEYAPLSATQKYRKPGILVVNARL